MCSLQKLIGRTLKALGIGALLFSGYTAHSQVTAWPDTTICPGASVTLNAQANFAPATPVFLTDDSFSGVVNLGFSFDYYGVTYTQCVIASNNYISFDLGFANGYSGWSINQAVPNNGNADQTSVFGPWQDINPSSGGTINYFTYGTAPNRVFVVNYCEVPMFSCTNLLFTSQIKLFEGSNIIETHIQDKQLCGWNGGNAVHATQDQTATIADIAYGRNWPLQWTTANEGTRWTPAGPGAYTISNVPYQPAVTGSTITWLDQAGTVIGTGNSITVTPGATTEYYAQVDLCSNTSTAQDTCTVVVNCPCTEPTPTFTNPTCNGACDGTITGAPNGNQSPWTVNFYDGTGALVQTTAGVMVSDTYNGACAGTYTIETIDASGCQKDTVVTLVEPTPVTVVASVDTTICENGTAILSAVAGGGTPGYTMTWDNGLIGNGPHNVSPIANNCYTVFATDANGCVSANDQVCVNVSPVLTATITPTTDTVCLGNTATLVAVGGGGSGNQYFYSWDDGTGVISNNASVTVTPGGVTTYCVTVTDDCESTPVTQCVTVEIHPDPVVTFTSDVTDGCYPVAVNFTNTTDPLTVASAQWDFGDGNTAVAPLNVANTYNLVGCYDVTLTVTSTDGCVASATTPSMICTYDYPSAAFNMSPDNSTVDNPLVSFENTSVGHQTSSWVFDTLGSSSEENPQFLFPNLGPGNYDVTLLVTNQWGCTDSITQTVIIKDNFFLYAPNSFTPDGDGINDVFMPIVTNGDPQYFTFRVFDRWGHRVFETTSMGVGWDGSVNGYAANSKTDTYVWKIEAQSLYDGGVKKEYIGHVTVLR